MPASNRSKSASETVRFSAPVPPRPSLPGSEPDEAAIRLRAFQIYEARGGQPGDPTADWEQARQELLHAGPAARLVRARDS